MVFWLVQYFKRTYCVPNGVIDSGELFFPIITVIIVTPPRGGNNPKFVWNNGDVL